MRNRDRTVNLSYQPFFCLSSLLLLQNFSLFPKLITPLTLFKQQTTGTHWAIAFFSIDFPTISDD
jgi:hypothetical protein